MFMCVYICICAHVVMWWLEVSAIFEHFLLPNIKVELRRCVGILGLMSLYCI